MRAWEGNFLRRNGEDLLSMIDTWYQSDISDNTVYNGDLRKSARRDHGASDHHAVDDGSLFHARGQRGRDAAHAQRGAAPHFLDLGPSCRQPAAMSRRTKPPCAQRCRALLAS